MEDINKDSKEKMVPIEFAKETGLNHGLHGTITITRKDGTISKLRLHSKSYDIGDTSHGSTSTSNNSA